MRPVTALAVPAALLFTVIANPIMAHANTLTFTNASCVEDYTAHLDCTFGWTGATEQSSIAFSDNGYGSVAVHEYFDAIDVDAQGGCTLYKITTITATVTDSISSTSRTVRITCVNVR